MIGITGRRSTITREFVDICNDQVRYGTVLDLPLDLDKYLLCHGVLYGESPIEMDRDKVQETWMANYASIIRFCDMLFDCNPSAKMCVIGSESGYKGSYDMAYAGSKAALHMYVENKRLLHPKQHLVCVAPTIIENSGMTKRRDDLGDVVLRGLNRRMGRWLNAAEVARVCNFALNEPSLSNTVIRMTGGNY